MRRKQTKIFFMFLYVYVLLCVQFSDGCLQMLQAPRQTSRQSSCETKCGRCATAAHFPEQTTKCSHRGPCLGRWGLRLETSAVRGEISNNSNSKRLGRQQAARCGLEIKKKKKTVPRNSKKKKHRKCAVEWFLQGSILPPCKIEPSTSWAFRVFST